MVNDRSANTFVENILTEGNVVDQLILFVVVKGYIQETLKLIVSYLETGPGIIVYAGD